MGPLTTFRGFKIFLTQNRFLVNIRNTLIYAVCSVVLDYPNGDAGCAFDYGRRNLSNFAADLYDPVVIPYVCSGILFRTMFHGQGPITMLIKALTGEEVMFLSDPTLAMAAVVIHQFWRSLPFAMLFTAARPDNDP